MSFPSILETVSDALSSAVVSGREATKLDLLHDQLRNLLGKLDMYYALSVKIEPASDSAIQPNPLHGVSALEFAIVPLETFDMSAFKPALEELTCEPGSAKRLRDIRKIRYYMHHARRHMRPIHRTARRSMQAFQQSADKRILDAMVNALRTYIEPVVERR